MCIVSRGLFFVVLYKTTQQKIARWYHILTAYRVILGIHGAYKAYVCFPYCVYMKTLLMFCNNVLSTLNFTKNVSNNHQIFKTFCQKFWKKHTFTPGKPTDFPKF
jgi:hypothetical protein